MKNIFTFLFISLFCVLGVTGQTNAAYVSNTSQPWNQNSIIQGMDAIFPSDWTHYFYPTVDASAVFVPGRSFVFVEGGDLDTSQMLSFLNNNFALIDSWVNAGGILFISAATNENFPNAQFSPGWGITSTRILISRASPYDVNHPFFSGSQYVPIVAPEYIGNYIAHNVLTGPGLDSIMKVSDSDPQAGTGNVFAEKTVGSGKVLFSGMTTPFFITSASWQPQPQMTNMLYALIDYGQVLGQSNTPPTAVCQDITVELDSTGNITINVTDIDGGSSDAEGSFSLSASQTSFSCSDIGANTVILTVTDIEGLSATCSAVVTVEDNLAPTAVGQDITVNLDATGNATITTGDIDNGSSDNCGIVNQTLDITAFTCADLGPNAVVYTVEDSSGNQDSVTVTVTVVDTIDPTVITQDITVQLDATGNATIVAADIDNGTSDNCSVVSL
ncbi:hypothetical protein N9W02_01860, partial [Flavobacteriaceae bacterium]|nr:hypothetical protein [Flavobacteriaceae bacterium]